MQTVILAFHGIGIVVTVLNFLTFLGLRRRLLVAFPKRGRLITLLVALPFWALLFPGWCLALFGPQALTYARDELPTVIAMSGMTFQLAVWFYGAFILFVGSPAALAGGVRRLRRLFKRDASGTAPERELIDEDRRRLLTRAALGVPVAIVATAVGGAVASRQLPVVNRIQLPVRRDLTALHGVTIAQVSDVHVGSYMDRERLDAIAQAMNSIGADYHVMTGDLIDNDHSQIEDSVHFLRSLKPRREKFMCMGNHEYIAGMRDGMGPVMAGLRESGIDLLVDESRKLNIGGANLWMMGIDYPPQGGSHVIDARLTGERTTKEAIELALKDVRDDGAPRILLSHHPRTFVQASEYPIDLTLSGHMHGGQLVAGRLGDFVLSPVLPFEHYHKGGYERNGRKLYVNSGAGGWMPVRINCPPEITLVELVPA